jgi:ADP-ribose pyrophosphatase YjhB (NUDIX family)
MVAASLMPLRVKPILLRVWRDVPFPDWMRLLFLRFLNPSFMVGAMALIQDEQGRVLLLEHTYRREVPWGLPGGWLKYAESPERGLAREVHEETGLDVSVDELLAADFWGRSQLDMLYRCSVQRGTYAATDETSSHRWVPLSELPRLLPNQLHLLRKAGVLP